MRSRILSFEEYETNILIIIKDLAGCKLYEYYFQNEYTYNNFKFAFGCYESFSRKHLEDLIKYGYFEPVEEDTFTELFSGEENEES